MARLLRVEALETPHHVTQRGNARREVFETDSDRLVYLSLLQHHAKLQKLGILGYCLMPNHVHLIAVPHREAALANALRSTHGRYAAYLNARHGSSGHVWQGRYYSCPMDENHLWTALRYAERNPVRAGMIGDPVSYPWSSARVHTCGGWDGILELDDFTARWTPAEWREFLEAPDEGRERDAIRRSTHCGRPLGDAPFVNRLELALARTLTPAKGGRPRKKDARSELAQLLLAVS